MAEKTGIAWTDATFNPWWGCTKVGPGCDFCYAEIWDRRVGGDHWGHGKPRREFSDKHWNGPLRWNRAAEQSGARKLVFCASMADVFDNEIDQSWRERLWALIRATPALTWQIVTKRIGNAPKMLPADWGDGYANVWLLATVVNQEEADRDVPKLLSVSARIHGLSVEPQLGGFQSGDEVAQRVALADAALIISAVNCHDEMVTALRAAKIDIEERADPCGDPYNTICAALAKAEARLPEVNPVANRSKCPNCHRDFPTGGTCHMGGCQMWS